MGTQFDLSLGCLLLSSWANMVYGFVDLFTLELKEILKYFGRYPRDPTFNKIMVLIALAGDILTVVACLSATYLYMVSHWGELPYLAAQPWGVAGYVIGTGITGATVQIFLTRMVFSLTKQWIWLPVIGLFIMVGIAGAGATAGTLIMDTSISGREALVKWVTMWLSGCIAADTFITFILVIKFQSLRTAFVDTRDLLRRLSLAAVRNGSITTTVTIVTIILFKIQPETNSALMLEITIGRVYSLCMLSNLNNRVWISSSTSGGRELSKGSPSNRIANNGSEANGTVVKIQKDVEYTSDDHTASNIPMDSLVFGRQKQDDAERAVEFVVTDKPGTSYVEF
ncbi:hypothetical protein B0H14DRAFT_3497389 [Mycena olivaceomarginata]|nr:hypothetical protein B0H14DRAFT_3497389 [Mycena olivaceomarginata]